LAYYGGGEKWIIQISKEIVKRGHDVEIYCLPFLLDGNPKINPKEVLEGIPYSEHYRHKIKADVIYITYNPLSWLNFKTTHPRIGGMHSHAYWQKPHPKYGLLPNTANIVNRFTSYFELRGFDAIHIVTNVYPINHPKVYFIPNFVDATEYRPCALKNDTFTIAYTGRKVWQKGWDIVQSVRKKLEHEEIVMKISGGQIPEEEMPSFLSSSHVTIDPSRVDTFGLSIIESMLCSTPVITTPLLTHKALELPLYYASTPSEYVDSINQLREMENYKEFSIRCRVSALKFDKQKIIDRIEGMFRGVVGE